MTDRIVVSGAKMPVAIVDPNPVRRPIVVADVQIRETVAVKVAESCGETPVQRRASKRVTLLIEEGPIGPGNGTEMALPVVEIQHVGLAIFRQLAVDQDQPVTQ